MELIYSKVLLITKDQGNYLISIKINKIVKSKFYHLQNKANVVNNVEHNTANKHEHKNSWKYNGEKSKRKWADSYLNDSLLNYSIIKCFKDDHDKPNIPVSIRKGSITTELNSK